LSRSLRLVLLTAGLALLAAVSKAQTPQLPLVLPSAVAFDAQGNLYITDAGAHVVRKLATDGTVSVVAGIGVQGFSGDRGTATEARLDSPMGIAVDGNGNLYVSDTHNHRVRKVAAASGIISTIAGTGNPAFAGDGGPSTRASLSRPTALAVDSAGDVYVADTGNHRIRKIDVATGTIATIAGSGVQGLSGDGGSAVAASLDSPYGIAVDAGGNLYIADAHNGRIRRADAKTGAIGTVAGTGVLGFGGDGSAGSSARVSLPRGVSVDANGYIYIADTGNQRIRRISPAGVITTIAGDSVEGFGGDGGAPASAALDSPDAIAVSPEGLVTFADAANRRVRQIDAGDQSIQSLPRLSAPASPALTFSGPATLTYGTGTFTAKLTGIAPQGQFIAIFDVTGTSAVAIGSAVVDSTGTAVWSSASLAAGQHVLQASCAGVSSPLLSVGVQPARVIAAAQDVSLVYGQAVPTITGVLTGVLPPDAAGVSTAWTTSAGNLSPPGTYPISAVLSGASAGNYTLGSVTGSVVIAKAPVSIVLSVSATSVAPGGTVVLTPQVMSTTGGVPTRTVSLMDGTTVLGSVAPGTALTTPALAAATHTFVAVYSGDANFLGRSSPAIMVTAAAPLSDFTLASSGASTQSVATGTAATFLFTVTMQGQALSSPILLAVQGIPAGATASLNPISVPPGSGSTTFTLTVQTPRAALDRIDSRRSVWWAILLVPAGMVRFRRTRSIRLAILTGTCILMALLPTGCGDRVNSPSGQSHTSTYHITVTGTATAPSGTAVQHSTDVTLEVY
jgi:sugar lactone lactonase YvrE